MTPKHPLELDAEIALRTIREECGIDRDGFGSGDRASLAFRSGQLAVVLMLTRKGRISLDALELAAIDRIVSPDELMAKILRPLVRRGFCRVGDGCVTATGALLRHRNAVEALMSGESLEKSAPVKTVRVEALRAGDYVFGVGELCAAPMPSVYRGAVEVCVRDSDGERHGSTIFNSALVAR